MGGNGSFSRGDASTEAGRKYEAIYSIGENVVILEQKDKKKGVKLPEESHTPNRIYVSFYKDGHDVKDIAKYGEDGKRIWVIHTADHRGLRPHFHYWHNSTQDEVAHPLTKEMRDILERVRNFK